MNACYNSDVVTKCNYFFDRVYLSSFVFLALCILQVKSAEKCNDFLHSLAAHFLFYLVI